MLPIGQLMAALTLERRLAKIIFTYEVYLGLCCRSTQTGFVLSELQRTTRCKCVRVKSSHDHL